MKKGALVEVDTIESVNYFDKNGKVKFKNIKVYYYGIWDGNKVECWGKGKVTVRNEKWVRKLSRLEVIFYYLNTSIIKPVAESFKNFQEKRKIEAEKKEFELYKKLKLKYGKKE